jgi:hypothetical protein
VEQGFALLRGELGLFVVAGGQSRPINDLGAFHLS